MRAKKVTNVRVVGHIKTMDIEVNNESHVFYGDGIATSNSHAVSYAINAYWSAYCKNYRRKKFYRVYMNRAEKKPKPDREKKQLIMDAKKSGFEVLPPRLQHLRNDFWQQPLKDNIIFGLRHIKGVGKEGDKIMEYCGYNKDFTSAKIDVSGYNWIDCLVHLIAGLRLNKRAVIALISVGAFNGRNNRLSRQKMLYDFDSWKQLTAREQKGIIDNHNKNDPSLYADNLAHCIENMLTTTKISKKREPVLTDVINSLKNPFYSLDDSLTTIAIDEEKYLSSALSCSKVDGLDVNILTNMCKDVVNESITGRATLAVEIINVKVVKTKNGKTPGQEMCFLTVEDASGSLETVVVFPEPYETFRQTILENNTVLLIGEVNKKDRSSFIVDQVIQI
jgi:DNA polymerase III alpha subunit